ncbi:MAG: hypothetical protein JW778_00180 [Candidatus Altiarchaeota archaeon]|nr:hypothetical protein [Candidatus Altiarchaeota archaeon]
MIKWAYVFVVILLFSACIRQKVDEATTTQVSSQMTTTTKATTTSTTAQSTTTTRPLVQNPEINISLSTDKDVYHSNELMSINVVVDSSHDLDVLLRIYGISAGYYRIDKTESMALLRGLNQKSFSYQTPRCYGCAGIQPGSYNVNVDVIYNSEVIASSTTEIEMQQ